MEKSLKLYTSKMP